MAQLTLETIKVQGNQLVDQITRLVHEGNVRRIVIKQEDRVIAEFPLTLGVVGAVLAPVVAAAGAIAALIAECTIEVERLPEPEPPADAEALKELNAPGP